MNKIEISSMYGTFGELQYLNEVIEYYEYQYNLCLDEGEETEAVAYKQMLDELKEKRYKLNEKRYKIHPLTARE